MLLRALQHHGANTSRIQQKNNEDLGPKSFIEPEWDSLLKGLLIHIYFFLKVTQSPHVRNKNVSQASDEAYISLSIKCPLFGLESVACRFKGACE